MSEKTRTIAEEGYSMELEFQDRTIHIVGKSLTRLDEMVLRFVRSLHEHDEYVLVSGYVSIPFGRSRGTEDVDVIIGDWMRASIGACTHPSSRQASTS
jgi:hypothetical protein